MAERKCALVTGSVTGMGRAMILRLARDGFDTVINYHRQERAEGARQLIREVQAMGTGAIAVQADVSGWCRRQRTPSAGSMCWSTMQVSPI